MFLDKIDFLFVINTNPAFSLPESHGFKDAIKKVKTVVSMQTMPNETDEKELGLLMAGMTGEVA